MVSNATIMTDSWDTLRSILIADSNLSSTTVTGDYADGKGKTYPIVVINGPNVGSKGITFQKNFREGEVNFSVDVFHISNADCKLFADYVINALTNPTSISTLSSNGLSAIEITGTDKDMFTDGQKKVHVISISVATNRRGTS